MLWRAISVEFPRILAKLGLQAGGMPREARREAGGKVSRGYFAPGCDDDALSPGLASHRPVRPRAGSVTIEV